MLFLRRHSKRTVQSARGHASFGVEPLESRKLMSCASDIGLIGSESADLAAKTTSSLHVASLTPAAAALPIVRRTYSGTGTDTKHHQLAFVVIVRKQENRGSYASLRGTVRIATQSPIQILSGDITYGKLRSNHALTIQFTDSGGAFKGTFDGKVNDSGSQLSMNWSTTGSSLKASGTFKIKKV